MKYGVWRHENALGNSAEQIVNLSNFINEKLDKKPIIYVETEFQRQMALCIPNADVRFYEIPNKDLEFLHQRIDNQKIKKVLESIYMPDVYFSKLPLNYPSQWINLINKKNKLSIPNFYKPKLDIDNKTICIQIREQKTYWKRVDGDSAETERFVNIKTYFDLALYFADQGFKVIRLGDANQTPMPMHKNIIDFALEDNRNMMDDLYISSRSKCFISCDSGIWPASYALDANLLMTNVVSTMRYGKIYKPEIMSWMKNVEVLRKKWFGFSSYGKYFDVSKNDLIAAVNRTLNKR